MSAGETSSLASRLLRSRSIEPCFQEEPLSTQVLDTYHGVSAGRMKVEFLKLEGEKLNVGSIPEGLFFNPKPTPN